MFAAEHFCGGGAGGGFHEEVFLGFGGEGGGDFGGGVEAAAAVSGDGGGCWVEGEGAEDGGIELHGCGGVVGLTRLFCQKPECCEQLNFLPWGL